MGIKEGYVQVTMNMKKSTKTKLKLWCIGHGRTIADVLAELIDGLFEADKEFCSGITWAPGIRSTRPTVKDVEKLTDGILLPEEDDQA